MSKEKPLPQRQCWGRGTERSRACRSDSGETGERCAIHAVAFSTTQTGLGELTNYNSTPALFCVQVFNINSYPQPTCFLFPHIYYNVHMSSKIYTIEYSAQPAIKLLDTTWVAQSIQNKGHA